MDMHMPVLHGLDALKIYRSTNSTMPHMPIVILTANATIEARRECEEAGVDAFLTKPIDAHTLLATISRLAATNIKATDILKQENDRPLPAITEDAVLLNENTLRHLMLLGDESDDFLNSVIQGFFREGEQQIESMKNALSENQYALFKELAHAMKGSSGNLGAEALYQICREISQLNQSDLQSSAHTMLKKISNDFNATRQSMIRYLDEQRHAVES
jgi:two-component system, sensor histidine kinase RpfC